MMSIVGIGMRLEFVAMQSLTQTIHAYSLCIKLIKLLVHLPFEPSAAEPENNLKVVSLLPLK